MRGTVGESERENPRREMRMEGKQRETCGGKVNKWANCWSARNRRMKEVMMWKTSSKVYWRGIGGVKWKAWVRRMNRGRERLKRKSYALGHYGGMLIWLVNDSDLAVWNWCLAGLMTAERLSLAHTHTHAHKNKESWFRHICQRAHARTRTRMSTCSHINSDVRKYVLIHRVFSHTHADSLAAGMCDLRLLSASRAEWVNMSWRIICFFTCMIPYSLAS